MIDFLRNTFADCVTFNTSLAGNGVRTGSFALGHCAALAGKGADWAEEKGQISVLDLWTKTSILFVFSM